MSCRPLVVLLGWVLVSASIPARGADAGPTDAEVNRAISRGLDFLKSQQEPKGNWTYTFNSSHDLGITALAGLALLENGVERSDPVIASADEVIRALASRSNQSYDLALAILFLARVQPETHGKNDAMIRRLAARLDGGEQGGMWTYTVPLNRREDDEDGAGDRERAVSRRRRPKSGDNSNTQFALLGMWAGGRHEFDPNAALEAIDRHFRESQNEDGRWGYVPGAAGTRAMTCAGLMGMAIGAARPQLAERQTARARGAVLAADPAFTSALAAVTEDARKIGPQSETYYLWSLERVCVALGLRQLGDFDWYAAGAKELLRRQRDDGSWPEEQWGSLPNSCLALLFLRKANLAFELDRVLKLPGAPRPNVELAAADLAPPPATPAPEAKGATPAEPQDEARVTVTGASDAKFPEISVEFEVKKPDGSYLLDARREDFRVTEYDQPVTITGFQAPREVQAHPTTVVLVVDRSKSMEEEDRIGSLKQAVGTFMQGLPSGSRVAVVAFGSEVKTICPFTSDAQQVRTAVNALTPEGATRYYDAVAEALEMLSTQSGRRAVLALTDGEDTFSQTARIDTVIVSARRLGLPVHTLGLGTEDEIESDALRRLAVETRGQYYPAREASQLRSVYEQIAERIRSSYSLVYKTDRKMPDGTLRPVRITYRQSRQSGETTVFIPGMVVPAAGWPGLFLILVGGLIGLAALPDLLSRRKSTP